MFSFIFLTALQITTVLCNTEKVIFLGPSTLQIPIAHPTLDDLQLDTLSPQHPSLRTYISAEFPSESSEYGSSTWVLLNKLTEGQRYEVRVCWAATQPTSFRLSTHELSAVFENPDLITSLAQYSESRQPDPMAVENQAPILTEQGFKSTDIADDATSMLFLQIFAAADYYTTKKHLMDNVPPVYVDIILDPFLLNVFPRSLVPTAVYITILAIGGFFFSSYISTWIQSLPKNNINASKKDT